jgi:hypothetical protein
MSKYIQLNLLLGLSDAHLNSSLASNQTAWVQTRGAKGFPQFEPPVDDLFWATTAHRGATSWLHMDADGFATAIDAFAGSKYWVVGRPDLTSKRPRRLDEVLAFANFEPGEPFVDGLEYEGILLSPGMVL